VSGAGLHGETGQALTRADRREGILAISILRTLSGLRARLLALVLSALVPVTGLVLYTAAEQRRVAAAEVQGQAQNLVQLVSASHERLLGQAHQLLSALARVDAIRAGDAAACTTVLTALLREHPQYLNLGLIEPDGDVFCSAVPALAGTNLADRRYFQQAVATRGFAVGDYQVGRITGRPSVNFGYPVTGGAGGLRGVVFAALDLAWLNELAAEASLPPGSTVTLLDREATILMRYPDPERWVGRPFPAPWLAGTIRAQQRGIAEATLPDSVHRIYAFAPLRGEGGSAAPYLAVGIPTQTATALANPVVARNLAVLALVAALTLLLARLTAGWLVLGPMAALLRAARRFGAGDLAARTGLRHGEDELGQLARAFDAMAASLEREIAYTRLLGTVAAAANQAASVEEPFRACLDAVCALTGWPVGHAYLRSPDPPGGFLPASIWHLDDPDRFAAFRELTEATRVSVGTGLIGRVAAARRPLWMNDVSSDPGFLRQQPGVDLGVRAGFAVPVLVGQEVGAVLEFYADRPAGPDPKLLAVMEQVGTQLGRVLERRQAEERLRALNAELEARVAQRTAELETANRELEAFSYSVSHDLRAPLRSIDGFSQAVLEDYADRLDAVGQDYLRRVRAATQRMGRLIDDLLKLARVARSEFRRERVDLSAMARAIARDLQKAEPERDVEFVMADGVYAEGDSHLLRLALQNLLHNAWKFTAKKPRATIEFGVLDRGGPPVYFVRDDGAGFDMAYAGKLFGAFQRLHSTSEFEGTGIGLATVQRIIQRHGGRIWAEGAAGRGATFYFTLP